MEEQSKQSHWVMRKKKEIVVVALLILIPMATARITNWYYWYQLELHPESDPYYEPNHNVTAWILPDDVGDPFVVQRIELGQRVYTQLLGREISILIEPYQ